MKGRVIQGFLGIVTLLLWISPSAAQDYNPDNFVITQFGMDVGLPQSSVNDIVQDKDGYLWIATFGGLARFDGNEFTTFNISNTEGLQIDRILALYADREGGIWIFPEANENIIQRYKEGKVQTYSLPDTRLTRMTIKEDSEGTIWLTDYEKVFRFLDDEFVEVVISKDETLRKKALEDTLGAWLAFDEMIFKTIGNEVVEVHNYSGTSDYNFIDVIEYPKGSGTLFLGTTAKGIFRLKEGVFSQFTNDNGAPSNNFLKFKLSKKNELQVIYAQNLGIWDGDFFRRFLPPSQQGFIYRSIHEDNEGNYWVGTNGNGLLQLTPSFITMIDEKVGLPTMSMLSLTTLNDGTTLLSTNCRGIYEWDGNEAVYSRLHESFFSGCNWSVFQDSKDRIWIGSIGFAMTASLDEPVTNISRDYGLAPITVFGIFEDSEQSMWILAGEGVYKLNEESKTYTRYSVDEGLYYSDARVIREINKGEMWIGTKGGVNVIKEGEILKYPLLFNPDGTAKEEQPYIRAIHKDEEGMIWIGTYGNGLFRILNDEVTNIIVLDGLFDNVISHIVEDNQGNFWMGSNRGVSKVSREQLNSFINGEAEEVQAYAYGTAEGMNSAETNGGFQPDVISDSEGNIYFPTVAGVAVVSTQDISRNEIAPPVYIEGVRTNEGGLPVSESISLPYDVDFLEIDYTAVSFTESENVQFRYRLEGLNEEWIDVGNNREALFVKIPPGNYTFTVIASNNDGVWNMGGASLEVNIIPPFWMTSWFYSILILLFLSSGFALFYVRTMRLKKENERQKRFSEQLIESQEQERRRIASELHDGLGQQILVIKNRVELAEQSLEDSTNIAEQLKEIKHSAISSISDVRSISHGLRPVLLEKFGLKEALNNLCEEIKNTSALEWSYHVDEVDDTLPSDKEINFFRVIQEGANNIIRHSEASEASIIIIKQNGSLKATLWDDGKGMSKEESSSFKGLGFVGMKERIDSFGGSLIIDSAPNEGTTIKIEIPITDDE